MTVTYKNAINKLQYQSSYYMHNITVTAAGLLGDGLVKHFTFKHTYPEKSNVKEKHN